MAECEELKDRLIEATRAVRKPCAKTRAVIWDAMLDHAGVDTVERVAEELETKSTLSTPCIANLLLESSLVDVDKPRYSPISSPHDKREWIEWLAWAMESESCCSKDVAATMKGDEDGTYEMTLDMLTHALRMSMTKIGGDYRNFVINGFKAGVEKLREVAGVGEPDGLTPVELMGIIVAHVAKERSQGTE